MMNDSNEVTPTSILVKHKLLKSKISFTKPKQSRSIPSYYKQNKKYYTKNLKIPITLPTRRIPEI